MPSLCLPLFFFFFNNIFPFQAQESLAALEREIGKVFGDANVIENSDVCTDSVSVSCASCPTQISVAALGSEVQQRSRMFAAGGWLGFYEDSSATALPGCQRFTGNFTAAWTVTSFLWLRFARRKGRDSGLFMGFWFGLGKSGEIPRFVPSRREAKTNSADG